MEPPIKEEVGEPPRIEPKAKKEEEREEGKEETEKEAFELPEIEEIEEPLPIEKEILEEPPKIEPKAKKEEEMAEELVLPEPHETDWTQEVKVKKSLKKGSGFVKEVKPKVETGKKPLKTEFIEEVIPKDVKELAKGIKRKKFEQEKGIGYEPEVSLEEKPEKIEEPLTIEKEEEKQEEVKPQPIKIAPVKKRKVKEKQVKKTKKPKAKALDKPIKELEKELIEKIRVDIREEEKAKLDEERQRLEQEKQLLEQQKILVSGEANKYDFRNKQFIKDKQEIAQKEKQLRKDKAEAEELLEKLPAMRKDYQKLQKGMKEIYERLELNDGLEEEIREREEALRQAQKRLERTEEKIKEEGFSDYLESELRGKPLVEPKFEEKDILKASHLEVYNMIDECKALLREKNISEAKKIYMKLREAYNTMKLKTSDEDMLHTAIGELYNDIKLAEMEGSGG